MISSFSTPLQSSLNQSKSTIPSSIEQEFTVTFKYNVYFTEQLFNLQNPLFAQMIAADGQKGARKFAVIVDDGILPHHPHLLPQIEQYSQNHPNLLRLKAAPIVVPGGETCKNEPALVNYLQKQMNRAGLCRHSYIVAIGGGALLDLVGYVAATTHRGIRLIRVPTTVLLTSCT